jgi:hypothetical protein
MNTRIKVFGLFATLIGFLLFQSFDKYDLTETYSEEFRLNADGTLDLYNKYGKVDIRTWDKQVAKIDIIVKVDARNEKKAQEVMDRILIHFSNNDNYVSAKTEIKAEVNNNGWTINYSNNFTIDYVVYMPINAHLKVFNKYGNTTIEALDRTVDAEIKYGNIDMENVKGDTKLMLGYGNANMNNMRNLNAEIKYSNLSAESVGNLVMDSKYSKLEIDEINDAEISSKYDNYRIGKVKRIKNVGKYDSFRIDEIDAIDIDTKYTDVTIDYLHSEMLMEQKYGGVKIKELGAEATLLDFDLKYTEVRIKNINTGYTLDMEGEHADYSVHDDFEVSHVNDEDECCDVELRGKYGNGATRIIAKMEYGGITFSY